MPQTITRRLPTGGNRVVGADGRVALDVPAGAFAEAVDLELTDLAIEGAVDVGGRRVWPLKHVRLEARHPDGRPHAGRFGRPVGLAVRFARADLEHFSEYMAGVDVNQAILPTVDGYQTDLCAGAASVSIPLRVPPGTNGLAPALTLSYSSAGPTGIVSEFHRTYEQAQASWVG